LFLPTERRGEEKDQKEEEGGREKYESEREIGGDWG